MIGSGWKRCSHIYEFLTWKYGENIQACMRAALATRTLRARAIDIKGYTNIHYVMTTSYLGSANWMSSDTVWHEKIYYFTKNLVQFCMKNRTIINKPLFAGLYLPRLQLCQLGGLGTSTHYRASFCVLSSYINKLHVINDTTWTEYCSGEERLNLACVKRKFSIRMGRAYWPPASATAVLVFSAYWLVGGVLVFIAYWLFAGVLVFIAYWLLGTGSVYRVWIGTGPFFDQPIHRQLTSPFN